MELLGLCSYIKLRRHDVREQLCRRGAVLLVLDHFWLADHIVLEVVSIIPVKRLKSGCSLLSSSVFLNTPIPYYRILYVPVILGIHRVLRRWNQTGQKHAGEPDIAKTFFSTHNILLWITVTATILDISGRLARSGLPGAPRRLAACASIALCLSTLGFKVAFTITNAPELLSGTPQYLWISFEGTPLVSQAQIVFGGLAISLVYNMYEALKLGSATKTSAKGKWLDIGRVFRKAESNSYFMVTTRTHNPFLGNSNQDDQHSRISSLLHGTTNARNSKPQTRRDYPNVYRLPKQCFLRFGRFQCYLLYRFVECIQWNERIQHRYRGFSNICRQLGRCYMVDICE